jgi:hypothetical protein
MANLEIYTSSNAKKMMEDLAIRGIYGQTVEEVASRLVDRGLIDMAERGIVDLVKDKGRSF